MIYADQAPPVACDWFYLIMDGSWILIILIYEIQAGEEFW